MPFVVLLPHPSVEQQEEGDCREQREVEGRNLNAFRLQGGSVRERFPNAVSEIEE